MSLRRACSLAPLVAALASPALALDPADVPPCGLYIYRAEIVRVIDGDTVVADIDLGFSTWRRDERLRLARIDAPEMTGEKREAGQRSKAALAERIEGRTLYICTIKMETKDAEARGSFGRYLVEIYDGPEHENVNDWLVREGQAERYE